LQILGGRAKTGKTTYCLREIVDIVKREPEGSLLILIVPEQATLLMEKELSGELGGLWRVQVLSFQRLAWRILGETGGRGRVRLTDSGKRMLVTRILIQNRDKLRRLAPLATSNALAEKLTMSINELKLEGVSPLRLREACGEGAEWDKTVDLALVYGEYEKALNPDLGDKNDVLTEAAAAAGTCAFLKGARFWVDAFTGFTAPERLMLQALLAMGCKLTVTMPCTGMPLESKGERRGARAGGETEIFAKPARTCRQLAALADLTDRMCSFVPVTEALKNRSSGDVAARRLPGPRPPLSYLEHAIFRYPLAPYPGLDSEKHIRLIAAADPRAEVRYAAEEINKLVGEGYRYSRIAVVTRDLQKYAPFVRQEFSRLGLPFFTDHRHTLSGHPLASLLIGLLDFLRAPWQEEALFTCLKTGFFPVTPSEIDILENHCLAYGVESWQWQKSALPHLPEALLEPAVTIMGLLGTFVARAETIIQEDCYPVAALSETLFEVLEQLEVPAQLAAWQAEKPDDVYSQLHAQIWREFVRLLDELCSILPEVSIDLTEYTAILRSGLLTVDIGVIPPRWEEIQVGSLERSRLAETDAVFLLGAADGTLPPQQTDRFLNTRERELLRQAGVELPGGGTSEYLEEMYYIYCGLTHAKERVYVTWPLSAGGQEAAPSFLVPRLLELFPDIAVSYAKRSAAATKAWRQSAGQLGESARAALWDAGVNVGVSQLERFVGCPFAHFAESRLRLQKRRRLEADAAETGMFLHRVLAHFGKELGDAGRRGEISVAWCHEHMKSAFLRELNSPRHEVFTRNARNRQKAERLRELLEYTSQILGEFAQGSKFLPWSLEKSFDAWSAWAPYSVLPESPDGFLQVSGKIDRIDTAWIDGTNYLSVIDYKSNQTTFALEKFHYGLSLQLPLYLEVALRHAADGKSQPAGFLYYPVIEPEVNVFAPPQVGEVEAKKKAKNKMRGCVLDREKVLNFLDMERPPDTAPMTGFPKNIDQNEADIISPEQMALLRTHLENILQGNAQDLLSGDVRVRPFSLNRATACDYCEYGTVCHFDPGTGKYNWLPHLEKEEIWHMWKEEHGGKMD
jgi:ATP-dependent helicase/nuclease subunit B